MKHLIEISKIVTKKKVRKIEIFDDNALKQKNSKFNEFYEALMSGKFKNDRDAAMFLYGTTPTDDKYRQLKSRFRKRLLNTLFFLDVNRPSASTYDRAYFSCNKDWTLVKILSSNNAENTAAAVAKQILATALKYKFADVIVNCGRILRDHASAEGDDKEFEEYDQYIKQFSNVLDAEIRSEELFQRVILNYHKPLNELSDLSEKIDTYCDALVGLSEMYDSPIVFYNMFLVWTYRYEMLRDYEAMLEVCNRAENYIEENPDYYRDEKLATFQLKKMSGYLHLQDFKNGKINAEKCLSAFQSGSDTWFVFMEYYFLLAMHTGNYINALAVFNRALGQTKFKKLTGEERERWKVYETYISYIVESEGDKNPMLKKQVKRAFKASRFLNDPILYPRNQRVLTLLMVIAQILFLLDKRDFSEIAERVERLKTYANRQLKKEENYRVIQFIRLLQNLVKADFQVDELGSSDKYLKRLKNQPFLFRGLLSELEVIPFEQIWGIILSKLK
ncbi:MAG TPA: hypothetical protein PKC40_00760 [Saprospiraceae bacterium]|nr:hypothetical protein [Saprospiraceae bacterium]